MMEIRKVHCATFAKDQDTLPINVDSGEVVVQIVVVQTMADPEGTAEGSEDHAIVVA